MAPEGRTLFYAERKRKPKRFWQIQAKKISNGWYTCVTGNWTDLKYINGFFKLFKVGS